MGLFLMAFVLVPSCSLEEEILDKLTEDVVKSDPTLLPNLLAPPLGQLRGLWMRENVWGLQEATTDECMFPTRGTDWKDGGVWEENYFQTWTPNHRDVNGTWDHLNTGISAANTALFNLGEEQPEDEDFIWVYRAQAKFLRAFYEYNLLDLYSKYAVRDPFDLDFSSTPDIYTQVDGFYRLVSLVRELLSDMKVREKDDNTPDYKLALYGEPTRDAGLMLLAKLYLNKEVYTDVSGWDSCQIYLDELIESEHYGLSEDYFSMFAINNQVKYKQPDDEGIFVTVMDDKDDYGLDNRVVWATPHFHYYQTFGGTRPSGTNWNGGCVTGGYLNEIWVSGTDTAFGGDVRWKDERTLETMGVNLGFNFGQQYDAETGDSITERGGAPLIFTFECPFSGANESNGVRVLKYPPRVDPVNVMRTPNDFLIWRYADAVLMKAECLARTGNMGDAQTIVNEIRTKRNAPELTDFELLDIIDERGRELYWEGHRRQDMIRFGTFLNPKDNKPDASPEYAKLLPIPQDAIDGTPGGVLTQNDGY